MSHALVDALCSAFRKYETLADFTKNELGIDLEVDVVGTGLPVRAVITKLIEYVDPIGRRQDLIKCAYLSNPGNALLADYVDAHLPWPPFSQRCMADIFVSCSPDARAEAESLLRKIKPELVRKFKRGLVYAGLSAPQAPELQEASFFQAPRSPASAIALPQATPATSAILLVFLSDDYDQNAKCRAEREEFLMALRQPGREKIDNVLLESRVFLVALHTARRPEEFKEIRVTSFSNSLDEDTQALKVVRQLENGLRIKAGLSGGELQGSRLGTGSAPGNPQVLLAEVTPDLEVMRSDAALFLRSKGIGVLPRPNRKYPQDSDQFEDAFKEDLKQCNAFIQFLSEQDGQSSDQDSTIYVSDQAFIARRSKRNTGLKMFQWRSKELSFDGLEQTDHGHLLQGPDVSTDDMSRFLSHVVLEVLPPPEPEHVDTGDEESFIFVNASSEDQTWFEPLLRSLLAPYNIGCISPPSTLAGKDLEEYVKLGLSDLNCLATLVVYGKSEPNWVLGRMLHARKVIGERQKPLWGKAICDGPPPEKPDHGIYLTSWKSLNCRKGVDDLQRFVQFVATKHRSAEVVLPPAVINPTS